jgi:hypothetical protein
LQFTPAGPLLAVRPYCSNEHYWQVYFDTNRLIRESFTQAGHPVPEQHYAVRGGVEQGSSFVRSSARVTLQTILPSFGMYKSRTKGSDDQCWQVKNDADLF